MALNTLKCNHLMLLPFKGLNHAHPAQSQSQPSHKSWWHEAQYIKTS